MSSRIKNIILGTLLAILLPLGSVLADSNQPDNKPISKIVVFGDSLSDIGNVQYLLQTLNKDSNKSEQYLIYPAMQYVKNNLDHAPLPANTKAWLEKHFDSMANVVGRLLQNSFSKSNAVPIVPTDPPYYTGHFSNACVWNEYLADSLSLHRNLNINTSNPVTTEYYDNQAFGGSWAMVNDHEFWSNLQQVFQHNHIWQKSFYTGIAAAFEDLINGKFIPPSFHYILNAYLAEHPQQADPNTLFFVFYGGNDYLNYPSFPHADSQKEMDTYTTRVVSEMISNTQLLIQHGANNIMLFNMPDLTKTPRFSSGSKKQYAGIMEPVIEMHNAKLVAAVKQLQTNNPNVSIMLFDMYSGLNTILANYQQYHYKVIDQPCITENLPGERQNGKQRQGISPEQNPELDIAAAFVGQTATIKSLNPRVCDNRAVSTQNPDDFVFFDSVHPTSKSHRIIAEMVLAQLKANHYAVADHNSIEPETACQPTQSISFNPTLLMRAPAH